ncbi:MAG: hypothetical protein HW395_1545, partial [candidate division NC10 bacterium]|nr:hypothetical protein [candidate division NC10 bacterium]
EQPVRVFFRPAAGQRLQRSLRNSRFGGRKGDGLGPPLANKYPRRGAVERDLIETASVNHQGHFAPEPMEWIQVFEGELPGGGTQFIPAPCQQCQNPPCVNVCPVAATFSTPEGTVLIDQDRCIGCRICMAACPYDRRFFNWGEAPVPVEAKLAPYDVEHQVPAVKGTVMKCDFCPDMMRDDVLPYCVQGCPNDAIYYGDLEEDVATNGKKVVAASRFLSENQAYHLREDLKTKPRVYYIAGHGEAVGRDAFTKGRKPTEWPWLNLVHGARKWKR